MVKKVLISLMFLYGSFVFSINDHVVVTHCFDQKQYNYADRIFNKNTQVISAITLNKKNQQVQERKTFFPKSMQDRSDFKAQIENIIKQKSIFVSKQYGNELGRRVEFKQDLLGQRTYAVVRDQHNSVSTMYPLLRGILANELDGKADQEEVYIATSVDKNNKGTDTFASVKSIKDASRNGIFLGLSSDKNQQLSYLVDISQNFPELFEGQVVERGSITVETDWINKRNTKN